MTTTREPNDIEEPSGGSRPVGFARAALRQFDECGAFLDYVHAEGAERVGAYGFGSNGWFGFDDVVMVAEEAMTDDMAEATTAEGELPRSTAAPSESVPVANEGDDGDGGEFSTTNVQVEGVDEPDIVKTDGDRVIAITDNQLHYIDIDGGSGTKRGSVALSDEFGSAYGHEILLAGDRAFVIAQGEGSIDRFIDPPMLVDDATTESVENDVVEDFDAEAAFATEPLPVEPLPIDPLPTRPAFYGPTTMVLEIDLSDPDAPRVTNTLSIKGRYISARAVGNTARIAVTSPANDLGFLYPSSPSAEESAKKANQELVRNSTTADWIPTYTLTTTDGQQTSGDLVSCDQIHAPSEFAGFDMLSIVSIDLDGALTSPAETTSVMATGDTVYASQDRLYVSTNVWLAPTIDEEERGIWEENYETAIHRFSIAGDGPASYEASGSVDGHLLNQFAMNDRDGTFFVATTSGTPWSSDGSESQIVALQVNGEVLEEVGRVGGLGKGERIFSVRYVGDTAYVVTFRQTDPFYVVDLADPRAMAVRGELKIPGYSSYLHPISDHLILGVGQDASEEGFTTGAKVSLFDVSNPASPIEVDVWTVPNSSSDAEFDHRAFLWWASTSTAVLPLTSWSDQFSGAVVLNVTADGIEEQGRITHVDEQPDLSGATDCQVLDASSFTEDDGELFWITQDPNSQMQLCRPDDAGGAAGFVCDAVPIDELQNWAPNSTELGIDVEGFDRFEFCWNQGFDGYRTGVRRTMVIDGQLWTLSNLRLQANDLQTLERTGVVGLTG